jgi:hypothetical protein
MLIKIAKVTILTTAVVLSGLALAKSTVNSNVSVTESAKEDYSSVNGSVRVADFLSVGDISSVNGNIIIGKAVTADSVEAVNGNIDALGPITIAGEVTAVNGNVSMRQAQISGLASTVNGALDFLDKPQLQAVETVNGPITIGDGRVAKDIETVNGDITLSGTQVLGRIRVLKPSQNWSWGNYKRRIPTIEIGPGASVQGGIRLEQTAKIRVHNSAKVPVIDGETDGPIERF